MSPEKLTTNNLSIMLKIVIICLMLSELDICEGGTLTSTDIEQLRIAFKYSSDYIEREIKGGNENAVIVIGTARSGKSTLINYLMGNKLIAHRTKNNQISIDKYDNTSYGPIIGIGSMSKTKNCTRFNSTLFPDLSIWDTAGFRDNRGPLMDITNAFYLYHLVKKVEFLKIVLLAYYDDFKSDNIEPFTNLLETIGRLFASKFDEFYPSISLVLSRVPPKSRDQSFNSDFINYVLDTKFLTNAYAMNISKPVIGFVKYLIHHDEQVAIFKKTLREGIVTSDIDFNIIDSIKNTYRIKKLCRENVGFTFDVKSKNSLHDIKNELEKETNNFASYLGDLSPQFFEESLGQVNNTRNNTAALEDIKRKFNDMKEHLNPSFNSSNIENQIEAIKKIDNNFRNYIEVQEEELDILNKISRLKFIYFLMSHKESISFISIKTFISNTLSNLSQLIFYCSLLQEEIKADNYQKEINVIKESYNAVIKGLQSNQANSESASSDQFWEDFWKKFPAAAIKNETVLSRI